MSRLGGFLCLFLILALPLSFGSLSAQSQEPGWGVSLSALVSTTSIDRPGREDWRAAENWRFRVISPSPVYLEVAYSSPFRTRDARYCPDEQFSGCTSDYGLPEFTFLTGSVGYQRTFGRFSPSIGIGGGRLDFGGDVRTAWLAQSALRVSLVQNLGVLLETRLSRVNWGGMEVGWNQEISLGLWLDLWPGDLRRSSPDR